MKQEQKGLAKEEICLIQFKHVFGEGKVFLKLHSTSFSFLFLCYNLVLQDLHSLIYFIVPIVPMGYIWFNGAQMTMKK